VCVSGTFTGSKRNWSVIEKEAYPIICACDQLSYLLLRPQDFRLFCDHRNLIYVFAPGKEVKKHIRGKLLRWAVKLMEYRYHIEHIEGTNNVWADMVSRWAGNHDSDVALRAMVLRKRGRGEEDRTPFSHKKRRRGKEDRILTTQSKRRRGEADRTLPTRRKSKQTFQATAAAAETAGRLAIRPFDDPNFSWPTLDEICQVQEQHRHTISSNVLRQGNSGKGWYSKGRLWIPDGDAALLQRLMVVAHCGAQGHRGRAAMMELFQRQFSVEQLRSKVDKFLASCLLCQHVKGGKVVPRPWGETFRCYERNGALHWDFLTVGESFGSDKYLLVLKDEATHYCDLVPCASPTSMVAAEAILDWHSRYGIPPIWFSDQCSHFKNEVVAEICKRLKSEQRYSVAHIPWINGSIERVNRDVIQVLKVLCLEYRKDIKDWIMFVPLLRASINHTPLPSLGNKAPVELFCALPLPSPLDFCVDEEQKRILELTKQPELIESKLQQLRDSVQHMHRAVAAERKQQTRRNKYMQTGARKANFSVGDFVLRSRVDQKYQDKLLVTWIGPYQIKRADKHSFVVQHLVTGVETDVHASRLKYYADKDYEVTEEVREHIASQGIVLAVAELKEHRWNASIKGYEILVSWKGLESIEDSWEPLRSLWKDIPVLIQRYAESAADSGLMKHIERTTRFAR
jgi:transposase InsO family protein